MQINTLSRDASSSGERLKPKASLITFQPQKNIRTYQVKQYEIVGYVPHNKVVASYH